MNAQFSNHEKINHFLRSARWTSSKSVGIDVYQARVQRRVCKSLAGGAEGIFPGGGPPSGPLTRVSQVLPRAWLAGQAKVECRANSRHALSPGPAAVSINDAPDIG